MDGRSEGGELNDLDRFYESVLCNVFKIAVCVGRYGVVWV